MTITILPEDNAVFAQLRSTGRITHDLRHVITRQWDRCLACGLPVEQGRPLFAGYMQNDLPTLVHARCIVGMKELASPVYCTMGVNISARDEQTVWRYMDFAKFVSMLQQQGIFMPRADELDDKFEGALGLASREAQWDSFYYNHFRETVRTAPPGYQQPNLTDQQADAEARRLLSEMKAGANWARSALVSCWHANTGESEALWRLYCPPPLSGIAIRSSVGKLWSASKEHADAVVGAVRYIDFREAFAHTGRDRLFFKRKSLAHENEIRLVIGLFGGLNEPERILRCNLNDLIDEVVVSPFAPAWFADVVRIVTDEMGFRFRSRTSELLDEPFY